MKLDVAADQHSVVFESSSHPSEADMKEQIGTVPSSQKFELPQGCADAATSSFQDHARAAEDQHSYGYRRFFIRTKPWGTKKQSPQRFVAQDNKISAGFATRMRVQHCFSMVGGLIAPPLVSTNAEQSGSAPSQVEAVNSLFFDTF